MRMDVEHDEEECESVNEQCVNVNKAPQKRVTKTGPDNLLEKNLKKESCIKSHKNTKPELTQIAFSENV